VNGRGKGRKNLVRGGERGKITKHGTAVDVQAGAVLAQKFWGGGIAPSVPSSPSPFSPFSESVKYEVHIGLHLKSIISRVANSVMG